MTKQARVMDAPEVGPGAEATAGTVWFANVSTPGGPARFWHFIPAEQFAQLKHFERARIDVQTIGDEPPVDEAAWWEICKFLGRSIVHMDRIVHVYQGEIAPVKIRAWPEPEILRLAKAAAIFHGLRRAAE